MSANAELFLPYGRQTIEDDDIQAVVETLRSDYLTTGPKITEFEDALKQVTTADHAIVVGNGTQALHLACLAVGLGPGKTAVVPSVTFLATANAVRYCGANVIFSDVDPDTGLMRPQDLQKVLDENPDVDITTVLPVHLAGQPVDLIEIKKIADKHNLKIIADSCHALGSNAADKPVGCGEYEDISVFSFHPVKTVAMGEGGAMTTNSLEMAEHMRRLRSHGMVPAPQDGPWAYAMPEIGFNYRATDMQCALGTSQIKKLPRFIEKREALSRKYDEALKPLSPVVKTPLRVQQTGTAWHLYAVRIDFEATGLTREELMNALREKGIGTQVHYIPVHTQPYYQNLYPGLELPGADAYYASTLSLPLFPSMTENDVQRVVDALNCVIS